MAQLVGGISGLLYNFTRWSVEETTNPNAFQIVVDDAKDFADECRWTAQGFVAYAATLLAGAPVKLTSTRPTPDRIVYSVRRAAARASPARSPARRSPCARSAARPCVRSSRSGAISDGSGAAPSDVPIRFVTK